MRTALSVFFYTIVFAFLGTIAIGFAFHIIEINDVVSQLIRFYDDTYLRFLTGLSGLIFILLSFAAAQTITGKIQREKTIAFTNPNGQVTVTLSAVEDLIRRLAQQMPEIKEAKADVRAHKKGIDIGMRVVLAQETNIPDFTSRLQELIATRVQDVFGIDETITVKIHVAKIVSRDEKNSKKRPEAPREEIPIPYQGIKI
ncbi:MAG: alkaline shock response membrane anchor protein AmaP [Candidatus Omnitrophica bacterium]|nr:alkaline shock response membrane anchor protein AmaP [Candidatus Omnitrophota bacterium]MDD5574035.1 alkaline shock response membrane anchor protein AmaP [Candidatus Omnitrophota bacterium]